jgi:REP element-mobilizing transposase RayT
MLFAGAQPISMIREQAQRMANALAAVPERDVQRLFDDEPQAAIQSPAEDVAPQVAPPAPEIVEEVEAEPESVAMPDVDSLFDPLTDIDEEAAAFDEDLLREPVSFIWLLRDLRMTMPPAATELLENKLRPQLRENQWRVNDLVVESDYVYLFAEIPGENILGKEEIDYLKQTSAELLQATYDEVDVDTLWADSYMVLTPGRELDTDDIQRFIRFARR